MSNSPDTPRNVAVEMPAQAAEFVEVCKTAGVGLDYLPRTLPLADKFVKGVPAEINRLAAYVGEVIRRETRGIWYEADGIALVYVGLDQPVDSQYIVNALVSQGRVDAGGTIVESSKAYCDLICRQQRQWLDRSVIGKYDSMTSLRTSMSPDARTAGMVLGLAQQAVVAAMVDWNEALDCSADSLDSVEKILGGMHAYMQKPEPADRMTDEEVEAASRMMGVYIGEIIRRHFGGQWRLGADGSFELPIGNATLYPVTKARKRIIDGPGENIRMYFNSMQKIIAS